MYLFWLKFDTVIPENQSMGSIYYRYYPRPYINKYSGNSHAVKLLPKF